MEREIVSKVADEIIKVLKESVKRHFGYLFCYKKKIQELESEIGTLKHEKTRIQGRVDRAKNCAEIIEDDVSNWLTEVQNMEDEVGKFLEDKVNENKKCFKCWCPDLTWRHRLGKGAEEKKASVIILKEKGCKFETLPVSHPAPYPEELQLASSGDYMTFNSRASVFNGIMGALTDSEVKLIGVHGPGGAGKTTLVKEAAEQVKKDGLFEEIVMAVVSKDANVRKIQEQLATQLNLKYQQDQELGRAGELWTRLKKGNKKILVIIDDVWEQINMKEIGIPIADGGSGCKVLLTSRRKGVCQKMEVQIYFPIEILKEPEAWSLFEKAVGNFVVSQSVAEEVCKECGGLPVAIVAVGAALKGKEGHVWNDALNQLKNSSVQEIPDIDPKLYTSLKWSYDYLEHEDAKSCFLLCCLFPEDADIPIEDLVRYCMALGFLPNAETLEDARNRVQAMVDLLISSCLLLRDQNENYVKMHDVIRDVAISITNDKQDGQGQQWPNKQRFLVKHGLQKWPKEGTWEHYTAVSIIANSLNELPVDLQCRELHTLLITCGIHDLVDVPDQFFNGMKKLTVLCLEGLGLSLPLSFTNLINLRMLQVNCYPLRDIGMIKNLKNNLEILILQDCDIKELVPEIGELTHLLLLDLERCFSLKVIPQGVISKLICLEELYISQAFNQWEGSTTSNKEKSNVSLTELTLLKQLTTLHIHIPDDTLLPNDLCFEKLIRFQISVGRKFPFSHQNSSRSLNLAGFRLNPKFNVLINRAEELHLIGLEGLETLFHETHDGRVANLKCLEVIDCHDLEYLLGKPKWIFSKLTEVYIANCSRLKYLWSSFCAKRLLQLQKLQIINCEIMEGVIEIEKEMDEKESENMMIDFGQLISMTLVGLPKLISFYPKEKTIKESPYTAEQSLFNEKVVFPALEELCIKALPNTYIWGKQLLSISERVVKSFCQLKVMTIQNCNKVANVIPFNMLCQLQNLERLCIHDCNFVTSLIEELNINEISDYAIKFPQLSDLKLEGLPNLRNFSTSKVEAQSLINHQVVFPKLKNISAVNLAREIHLGPVMTNVEGSLEEVTLEGFDKITLVSSPPLMQRFISLSKLVLRNCPRVTQLFDLIRPNGEERQVEPCIEVKELKLYGLIELTYLWKKDPFAVLAPHNLKSLTVHDCSPLRNLFTHSVASSLEQLLALSVASCKLMEEVVTNEGEEEAIEVNIEFPKLRWLMLGNLPNLESFCGANYTFNFPSLTYVILWRCPKMQTFTSGQTRMPKINLITGNEDVPNFWIGHINKHLKIEDIATALGAFETDAIGKNLRRELIDEGIDLRKEYFEFFWDIEDKECSKSDVDTEDEEPSSEFDVDIDDKEDEECSKSDVDTEYEETSSEFDVDIWPRLQQYLFHDNNGSQLSQ